MQVITDIGPEEFEQIRALVEKGVYRTVQQFIAAAVANQLYLESTSQGERADGKVSSRVLDAGPIAGLEAPPGSIVTLEPTQPRDAPLWGQYYRFLPLKVVLRLVAASTTKLPMELGKIAPNVSSVARAFAKALESLAPSLEVSPLPGFPATAGTQIKMAKSESRFLAQYLGTIGKDGRPRGFPFELGFLARDAGAPTKVALSPAGLEFVGLANPLIDERNPHSLPLSLAESGMVLRHISDVLPEESTQIKELLLFLQQRPQPPASLDGHFTNYYRRKFGPWSEAKCKTMRAGLTSRCVELGLIVNREGMYALGPHYRELMKVDERSS